jgi:hypothetical protein
VKDINFILFYRLDHIRQYTNTNKTDYFYLIGDFSSDAQFFVATGVLSFLYCIGITVVYIMFDAMYQSNGLLPLAVRLHLLPWKFMVNHDESFKYYHKILFLFSIHRISS